MAYYVLCPPYHESRHAFLHRTIKNIVGDFPHGLLLNTSVLCSREYIGRYVFDFAKGFGSMAFTTNTGLIEAEGEIVVPSHLKGYVAKDLENVTLEGMWHGERQKPCKVVEQHAHGDKIHLHFKCSLYHIYGSADEELAEKLAGIYRKYAEMLAPI